MVDEKRVTIAPKVTPIAIKKRYKRRLVTGGHGLELNEAATFYRGTNLVPKTGKHNHLINPGAYSGPVWPAYGAYLLNPNGDRDGKRRIRVERFVCDLVAYEFLGPPPGGWADTLVVHLDGDRSNAAPDNLSYVVDEAKAEAKRLKVIEEMMAVAPRGPRYEPRVRDPYGVKTRNPYGVKTLNQYVRMVQGDRREGADLRHNPAWLDTRPRMLEPAS